MCSGTEENYSGWEGWPLPQTENEEVPDISLYARDAVVLAKKFVRLTGPSPRGPRAAAQPSQLRSLEDRTAAFAKQAQCFKAPSF